MGVAVGKVADPVLRARLRDGPFEVFERRPESRVVIVVDGDAGAGSMSLIAPTPCSAARVAMMPRTLIPPRCRSVRPKLGKRRGISLRRSVDQDIPAEGHQQPSIVSPPPNSSMLPVTGGSTAAIGRGTCLPGGCVPGIAVGYKVTSSLVTSSGSQILRAARVREANPLQVGGHVPGEDREMALFSSRSATRSKWSPCRCESRTKWSGDRSFTSIAGFVTHSEVSP